MSRHRTRFRGQSQFVRYMPTDVPDDQRWYWTEAWQRGERQASKQIAKGFTTTYYDEASFMRGLFGPPSRPWKKPR